MKEVSTTFEQATIANRGSNLSKSLGPARVSSSSKAIFVGEAGNWKLKWKDVQKFEIDNNCIFLETEEKTVELVNADTKTWCRFRESVQKRWGRLQGGGNNAEDEFDYDARVKAVVTAPKKPRATRSYGTKASRHKRILQSALANSKIAWSDDEEDTKETPPPTQDDEEPQEEESQLMPDVAPRAASDDEATVVMSDTDSPPPQKRVKRTKLRFNKKVIDADSEDEGLFDDAPMTTNATNRLVTPRPVFDEDDEEEENEPVDELKNQGKVSDFFKTKPVTDFFKPKLATTSPTTTTVTSKPSPKIQTTSPILAHTPLKSDNKSWLEGSPTRSIPFKSPFKTMMSPTRSISRHFMPPRNLNANRDSIEDSEEEGEGSHKKLRLNRRKFANCSSYGRSKADSVLESAVSSPRTSPFALQIRSSAVKHSPAVVETPAVESPAALPTKWKGLRNLGNTCYLNSSLQLFYTVTEFCSRLVGHGGDLSKSLTAVAKKLQETASSSVSPRQLKQAVDAVTDRFSGYEQRDAHEFLSDLIDRVHDELEETEKGDDKENKEPHEAAVAEKKEKTAPPLTDEFFRMNVQVCLRCDSCGYERTMDEMYRHLSIEVDRHEIPEDAAEDRPKWTVSDGLQKFFESEQREVKCEKCDEGTTATQTLAVISQPKALILQLKRFVVREKVRITRSYIRKNEENEENKAEAEHQSPPPVEMIISKNKDPVVVPESFDLGTYLPQQKEGAGKYKLSGIVHHHGSTPSSGHYTADAVRLDGEDTAWVSFDDGNAYPANINKVLKSPHSQRTAYMLLYMLEES